MHIKHHKNFIQNLENFKNKYRRSGLGKMVVEELRGFMLDWVSSHIINVDSKYAKLLKETLKRENL